MIHPGTSARVMIHYWLSKAKNNIINMQRRIILKTKNIHKKQNLDDSHRSSVDNWYTDDPLSVVSSPPRLRELERGLRLSYFPLSWERRAPCQNFGFSLKINSFIYLLSTIQNYSNHKFGKTRRVQRYYQCVSLPV